MNSGDGSPSPLEVTAGETNSRVVDAFSKLGNSTRLSIMLALWEAYEPFAAENTVPFSALRNRVGIPQGAQFTYHLDKLVGHFVEKTDDGYELRRSGHELVRTVIAGAGLEEPSREPTEIDIDCAFCGAPTAVTYRDEWLYLVCTECEGAFGGQPDLPQGMLSGTEFDPAGLVERSPADQWRAGWLAGRSHIQLAIEGVCDACSGPMHASLDVCPDHDPEGVCDECGRRSASEAQFRCPVCKNHHRVSPRTAIVHHPTVVAFYHERGVDFQWDDGEIASLQHRGELIADHEQELVSRDPLRVRVTISHEGDELSMTLDEDVDVVEVTRTDRQG